MPSLLDPFILQIFALTIGIAIISGSMGCFVVWRKMAYYSDALSHSALLGVVIGMAGGIGITGGLLLLVLGFSVLLFVLERMKLLGSDAILGLISHVSLALGVVILGLLEVTNVDLLGYLFGDILLSSDQDLWLIYGVASIVLSALLYFWQPLLLLTLHEDLAKAEGLSVWAYHLLFVGLMALTVAVSVQVVGVLLITALLIIPPAIARIWSNSAKNMFFTSNIIAILCAVVGIVLSVFFDLPTGPAIVLVLGAVFLVNYSTYAVVKK